MKNSDYLRCVGCDSSLVKIDQEYFTRVFDDPSYFYDHSLCELCEIQRNKGMLSKVAKYYRNGVPVGVTNG